MSTLINLCPILLAFAAGVLITAGFWCSKHPEDFYSIEETDPDAEVELEEIDHV